MLLAIQVCVPILVALITLIAGYGLNQFPAIKGLSSKWGTLIRLTFLLALSASVLTGLTSETASALVKQRLGYVGVALAVAVSYEACSLGWAILRLKRGDLEELSLQDRLVGEVRFWVRDRLKYAVGQQDLIELPVEPVPEKVGGVDRSADEDMRFRLLWNRELKVRQGERNATVEVGIGILEAFEHESIQQKLLILGDPGSGKTTTLLKLAEALLTQEKSRKQFPYIFELSAWQDDWQELLPWMVEQLKSDYGIDPKESEQWIRNLQLVPLLDGLDELGIERQKKRVEKINAFASVPGQPVVVCCRTEEYAEGQVRLTALNGALCLQPLKDEQIEQYLSSLDRADIWQMLKSNPEMNKLLEPYVDQRIGQFLEEKKVIQAIQNFALILRRPEIKERVLTQNPKALEVFELLRNFYPNYSDESSRARVLHNLEEAISLLSGQAPGIPFLRTPLFLKMMVVSYQKGKSITSKVALLDEYIFTQLRLDVRQRYRQDIGMKKSKECCSYKIIEYEPANERTKHYLTWLAKRLNEQSFTNVFSIELMQPSWLNDKSDLLLYRLLLFSISSLLTGVISLVLSLVPRTGGIRNVWLIPLMALLMGAVSLSSSIDSRDADRIKLYDNFRLLAPLNTWRRTSRARKFAQYTLVIGFCSALVVGMVFYSLATWNITSVEDPVSLSFRRAAQVGVYAVSLAWLGVLVSIGVQTGSYASSVPNQGIFSSARSSIITAAVFFPFIAFFFYFFTAESENGTYQLSTSIFMGLSMSILLAGGGFGGLSVLQHFSLRCLLFYRGYIPWNYAKFLKYTTERRLTQQIGGRFRFIHRELLDHFAAMDSD